MEFFSVITGFLIIGFLYFFTPIVTWIVLAPERTRSTVFWCGGGMLLGIGTALGALNKFFPDILGKLVLSYFLLLSTMLRAHGLLVFVGRGLNRSTWGKVSAVYIALFTVLYFVVGGGFTQRYVTTWHIFGYTYLLYVAWLVSKEAHSQSILWISGVYCLTIIALGNVLLESFTTGKNIDFLAATPANILLITSGIASAFLSHIGYVGMVLERTRQREKEAIAEKVRLEVLCQFNEQIAHLQRQQMMGDFAICLAHEINQPLTVILSSANLANRGISQDRFKSNEVQQLIGHILVAVRRASHIIDQIRRYIRPITDSTTPTNIDEAILEAIEILRLEPRFNCVEVQYVQQTEITMVLGNHVQVSQILTNAIRNAMEAVVGIQGFVQILVCPDEDEVCISVFDNGPGFSPEALVQAGQGFFSTKPEGLGVGLSVSRNIAVYCGGSLVWGNQPNGGGFVHLGLRRYQVGSEVQSS